MTQDSGRAASNDSDGQEAASAAPGKDVEQRNKSAAVGLEGDESSDGATGAALDMETAHERAS
jgi:hypothetical protein